LLLPFLATSVVGPGVIAAPLYRTLRQLQGLNTQWGATVPLWSNGLTVMVFLLFFLGIGMRLDRVIPWKDILRSMMPLILLIGVANMYWASQSLFWPFIVLLSSKEDYTPGLGLFIEFRNIFSASSVWVLAPSLLVAAIFAVGFVLCTRLFITRIGLESR
jgi:ABC-type glycerol-3-phosphate transport system permease component